LGFMPRAGGLGHARSSLGGNAPRGLTASGGCPLDAAPFFPQRSRRPHRRLRPSMPKTLNVSQRRRPVSFSRVPDGLGQTTKNCKPAFSAALGFFSAPRFFGGGGWASFSAPSPGCKTSSGWPDSFQLHQRREFPPLRLGLHPRKAARGALPPPAHNEPKCPLAGRSVRVKTQFSFFNAPSPAPST